MTLSSSVALRTVVPQVEGMEADCESLETDVNASLEATAAIAPANYFVENFSGNLPIPMNYQPPCAFPGPSFNNSMGSQESPANCGTLEVGDRFVLLGGSGNECTTVDQVFDEVMDAP